MNCNYKEPSREEKLKSAIKYLQYLEKELQSAKGYWKKLTTKQEILRQLNYIEELEVAND